MAEISLSKDIDIAVKTESLTKRCLRPILATSKAIKTAEEEAAEKGKALQFSKEIIQLSTLVKPNSKTTEKGKKAVIISICNDRIEDRL